MTTLSVKDISGGYGPIEVIKGVSFDIQSNSILGILGRNGMGKSTLMKCISGILPTKTGSVVLGDKKLDGLKAYQRARSGLSAIPQDGGIFPQLTVRENLRLGRLSSREHTNRTEEVLTYFPRLRERISQPSGTLSGGERRMLSIGRALMTNPSVLLLDEPSEGVMPILVKQIAKNLVDINANEGLTIIVVEQNVPMVRAMSDHCLILEKGRIVVEGTTEEVCSDEVLHRYLTV